MSYEIKGEIVRIEDVQTFASGFQKRNIVVKTLENYPQEILIEFMKDKVDLPDAHSIGSIVTVSININGRMWESPTGEKKWFNSIIGWKMIKEGGSSPTDSETHTAAPYSETPKSGANPLMDDDTDDNLPF